MLASSLSVACELKRSVLVHRVEDALLGWLVGLLALNAGMVSEFGSWIRSDCKEQVTRASSKESKALL